MISSGFLRHDVLRVIHSLTVLSLMALALSVIIALLFSNIILRSSSNT